MTTLQEHYQKMMDTPSMIRGRRLHNRQIESFLDGLDLKNIFKRGEPCLDVGCGLGYLVNDLAFKFGVIPYGIDVASPGDNEAIALNINFRTAMAEDLPFEDNHFGSCFSYFALHYVPQKLKAVSEIHRVLKQGASAVIDFDNLVPNDTGTKLVSEYTSPTLEAICKTFDTDRQVEIQRVNLFDENGKQTRRSQRVILTKKTEGLKFPQLRDFKTEQGPLPFAYSYY